METFEFTVIGEHLNTTQITADHYALKAGCEVDARNEAIRSEARERPDDWSPICVVRGHVEVCWAKDE